MAFVEFLLPKDAHCSFLGSLLCRTGVEFSDGFPVFKEFGVEFANLLVEAANNNWWSKFWAGKLSNLIGYKMSETYTSPRLFRLSVASSNEGGGSLSFLAPKILFISEIDR